MFSIESCWLLARKPADLHPTASQQRVASSFAPEQTVLAKFPVNPFLIPCSTECDPDSARNSLVLNKLSRELQIPC
jgi:hypothetical protein